MTKENEVSTSQKVKTAVPAVLLSGAPADTNQLDRR